MLLRVLAASPSSSAAVGLVSELPLLLLLLEAAPGAVGAPILPHAFAAADDEEDDDDAWDEAEDGAGPPCRANIRCSCSLASAWLRCTLSLGSPVL